MCFPFLCSYKWQWIILLLTEIVKLPWLCILSVSNISVYLFAFVVENLFVLCLLSLSLFFDWFFHYIISRIFITIMSSEVSLGTAIFLYFKLFYVFKVLKPFGGGYLIYFITNIDCIFLHLCHESNFVYLLIFFGC